MEAEIDFKRCNLKLMSSVVIVFERVLLASTLCALRRAIIFLLILLFSSSLGKTDRNNVSRVIYAGLERSRK